MTAVGRASRRSDPPNPMPEPDGQEPAQILPLDSAQSALHSIAKCDHKISNLYATTSLC